MLIHAAGESVDPGSPVPKGTYAVALWAEDEEHLLALSNELCFEGIRQHLVVESDGPYACQAMAFGCSPVPRGKVRRLLSQLPCVK